MTKNETPRVSSCTITWENPEDRASVVTKALQTEIQVRFYRDGVLTGGRIFPMSEGQKQELYAILSRCLEDWNSGDFSAEEKNGARWTFRICSPAGCLKSVRGTAEPPHGAEIRKILTEILGEENCCFF